MSAKVICVGAALQETYLSHTPVFKPVHEGRRGDFTEIKLGDNVEVEKVSLKVGGAAVNAAVTFARYGLPVGLASVVGHDTAGQAVLELLDREGIDRRPVGYSRTHHTGCATILVAPSGERTVLVHHGAAADFGSLDLDSILLAKPEWVYVTSLMGDFKTLRGLLERCVAAGAKVVLNPGPVELKQPGKLKPLLEDVDLLIANRDEAAKMVSGASLDELVHHCLNLVPSVAITAGSDGSIVSDGRSVVRAGLYEDAKVVDRTGAGDAFGAALVAALMGGKPLDEAVVLASANTTSVVSTLGANSGAMSFNPKLHAMPIKETKLR